MTKEGLIYLASQYASEYMTFNEDRAKQQLSDAIDAALAKARSDALEKAAQACESAVVEIDGRLEREDCAKAVRALKEKHD